MGRPKGSKNKPKKISKVEESKVSNEIKTDKSFSKMERLDKQNFVFNCNNSEETDSYIDDQSSYIRLLVVKKTKSNKILDKVMGNDYYGIVLAAYERSKELSDEFGGDYKKAHQKRKKTLLSIRHPLYKKMVDEIDKRELKNE